MTFDCDVLIAGGGPTGVTLAALLAQRGVKVIVAEKEADIYPLPRAAHVDHECMRILQEAGAAAEIMATSRSAARYDFRNAKGEILLRFAGSDQIGPGGWPIANMIHQPSVEAALRRSLAGLESATLNSQWEVTSFADNGDGVTARVLTPEGERIVHTRYVVGADGARSPLREASEIAFDDLNFEEPWLVVDALVDDPSRLPRENLQICDPERPTTCVVMSEGRHRWEFMIKPGETAEQVSDDAFIEKLLQPWNVKGAVRLERKAVYTFRARIARNWRKGRVLLAGDAAHQTPPFAGQGMCSGLRDAANLAWKLATVIKGDTSDALLDSYQPEREPNVRATIAMAIMMGRTVCITSKWGAFLRDMKFRLARTLGKLPDGPPGYPPISTGAILAGSTAAGHYFPQPISDEESQSRLDDALGSGSWLVMREPTDLPIPANLMAVALSDAVMAPFAHQVRHWLDAHRVDAVLVRPDRYVFGTGSPDDISDKWLERAAVSV